MPNKTKLQKACLRWAIVLLIGCMVLLLANCVGYTKRDKIGLGAMLISGAADGFTANKSIQAGAVELSPFLGEDPSAGSIAFWTIGTLAIKVFVYHKWPAARKYLGPAATFASTVGIISNVYAWQEMESRE